MPSKPSAVIQYTIASQFIARTLVWVLVFSFEFALSAILKSLPDTWKSTYLYYVVAILMTTSLFVVIALRAGNNAMMRDIRELCFYDMLVQWAGLAIFFTPIPTSIYWALCYIVLMLKFTRLLWPARNADKTAFVSWPESGMPPVSDYLSRHLI
jgi:hypothetical protein